MPVPWLGLIDAALGVVNFARSRKALSAPAEALQSRPGVFGAIESRLAGVVVAALKEAFDRDARRLELEREHMEAERLRAERALKLELLRQAADREVGRLRLIAGVAVASFVGTLLLTPRVMSAGLGARATIGVGWALLLGALAAALAAQSQIEEDIRRESPPSTAAGAVAPWLIVAALAFIGVAALIS